MKLNPEIQASLEPRLQEATIDGEISATIFVNICHELGVEFVQLRPIVLSEEYKQWVENKALHYQHKSSQLLGELDRLQLEVIDYKEQCDRLQQEMCGWQDENSSLTQELEHLKSQLATSPNDHVPNVPSTIINCHDNNTSIPEPDPLTEHTPVEKYIKGAEVGILEKGAIADRGKMIGQLGEKVRVLCQTGGNQLFELTDLVLLGVPQPTKKTRNLLSELRSFSSV